MGNVTSKQFQSNQQCPPLHTLAGEEVKGLALKAIDYSFASQDEKQELRNLMQAQLQKLA